MTRVIIWGGSGLTGGELLRLLAGHRSMEVVAVTSRRLAGQPVWTVHPHLRPDYPDLLFVSSDEAETIEADLAFLALPHGSSFPLAVRCLERGLKVVDLSADLRLRDGALRETWYGPGGAPQELIDRAVYGLPEFHREALAGADLASGVGCNATALNLALFPLARAGLIEEARAECRVGSSEGGAKPSEGGHHPFRSRALRVIEPFRHRHMAEVLQELDLEASRLTVTMTAVEMVRGIQMVAHIRLTERVREADLWRLYRGAFGGEFFLHLTPARPSHLRFPDPRLVMGSNRALVGFALDGDGRRLLLVSAIDNLVKGASGSALQSANLMMGLDEREGLEGRPVYPA